jgi:hypothetical protein
MDIRATKIQIVFEGPSLSLGFGYLSLGLRREILMGSPSVSSR